VFRFPPLTPFVRSLLIALAALFVLGAVLQNFLNVPVVQLLALDPTTLSVATLWQVVTHVFVMPPVPGAVLSLMISMLFMWLIMAPFEERYGRNKTLQLIVVSAVSAALPAIAAGQLAPGYSTLVAGPQTITLAGICAYAMVIPPYAEISFFGLFPMKPKQLIYIVAGLSLVGFLTSKNGAQLAADLGAIAGGVGYARYWMLRAPRRKIFGGGGPKKKGPKLRAIKGGADDEPKRWLN
jgi:membrane associated rhomboid family serine protease